AESFRVRSPRRHGKVADGGNHLGLDLGSAFSKRTEPARERRQDARQRFYGCNFDGCFDRFPGGFCRRSRSLLEMREDRRGFRSNGGSLFLRHVCSPTESAANKGARGVLLPVGGGDQEPAADLKFLQRFAKFSRRWHLRPPSWRRR